MADNADAKPSKTRFLSKSKWGKVFKENGTSNPAGDSNNFSLNEDVIDFLKPSREASAERLASVRPQLAPKLDIAIAQRWPSANEVRLASSTGTTTPTVPPFYEKPTRRPGLRVSFAKTAAEIIGEGGEESEEPTSEISKRRVLVSRSVSERRPGGHEQPSTAYRPPLPGQTYTVPGDESIAPGHLRRANTSYKETSHPLERKYASPPVPYIQLPQVNDGRVGNDSAGPLSREPQGGPSYMTNATFDANPTQEVNSSRNEETPSTARRQRMMRANEGMAFRRASALILNEDDITPEELTSLVGAQHDGSQPRALSHFDKGNEIYRHRSESEDLHPGFATFSTSDFRPNVASHLPDQITASHVVTDRSLEQANTHRVLPMHNRQPSSNASENRNPPLRQNVSLSQDGVSHQGRNQLPFQAPAAPVKPIMDATHVAVSNVPQSRAPLGHEGIHVLPQQTANLTPRKNTASATVSSHPPRQDSSNPSSRILQPPDGSFRVNNNERIYHQERGPTENTATSHPRRVAASPTSPARNDGDAHAKAALQDFGGRVKHMKGVFKLTSDKERPGDSCGWFEWLHNGLWWYLNAKLGFEGQISSRSQHDGPRQQLLTQAHVDLAKALWISDEQLLQHAATFRTAPTEEYHHLEHGSATLRNALEYLALQMTANNLMPPHQSLIQGQDIRIWLSYPVFTATITALLSGSNDMARAPTGIVTPDPLSLLPIGDSSKFFCFGRFIVDAVLATNERETDRVPLPAICSILRSKNDYQISIAITSQNSLVKLHVEQSKTQDGSLSWENVSWKPSTCSLILHLSNGFDAFIRLREHDFRRLSNMYEHSRSIDERLRPQTGETLLHHAHLLELQYNDGIGGKSFPSGKLHNCRALVYEQKMKEGPRRYYVGVRLVLLTEADHKNIVSVDHVVCKDAPLYYEYLTDAAANGTTAMVIRFRDQNQSCKALLVFPDMASRQVFHDSLNGLYVSQNEAIVGRTQLVSLDVKPCLAQTGPPTTHQTLKDLQWQKLGITNMVADDVHARSAETICSENLRLVIRHAAGTFTDRMNLSKGELLVRLPCDDPSTIQIYREPQEDFGMSLDVRSSPPHVADAIWELLRVIEQQATIRQFTFATATDLHTFQACIMGYNVLFDGNAASFGISRRMMVVPIYHKWQASKVRVQVVAHSGVTKVLAFMDDFSHADAMCIQVKSMDVFETGKGDGKSKKWTVKMVDAKFSLPKQENTNAEAGGITEEQVRRRFVNLEGLEYAEEHDDITIGFETQAERDGFAKALPAATTVGRMITLKRRI